MSDLPHILPGAQPQFYRGNEVGCLLIHGFMASPGEVGWLGKHLAGEGYTVSVLRLPGMGTNPADMQRMRWQDWYMHVLDAYHILKGQCQKVIVIGHSMGGMLGMLLASAVTPDGLVVAASPTQFNDWRIRYAKVLQYILPFTQHPTPERLQNQIYQQQRRRGEEEIGRVNYTDWHTRAAYEIYTISTLLPEHLPRVTAPLLLLYAEQDDTAPPKNMDFITQYVSSQGIEQHILKNGKHIIFQDEDMEEAFRIVSEFVRRLTG